MPLLYGEGEKAFMRLQEEIIRTNPDESIFAWDFESELTNLSLILNERQQGRSMLARSPCQFRYSSHLRQCTLRPSLDTSRCNPVVLTNRGLEIEIPVASGFRAESPHLKGIIGNNSVGFLNCEAPGSPGLVGILLWEGIYQAHWRMLSVGDRSVATFLVPPEVALAAKAERIHVYVKYHQIPRTIGPPPVQVQLILSPSASFKQAYDIEEVVSLNTAFAGPDVDWWAERRTATLLGEHKRHLIALNFSPSVEHGDFSILVYWYHEPRRRFGVLGFPISLKIEHKQMAVRQHPKLWDLSRDDGPIMNGRVKVHHKRIFWQARRCIVASREIVTLRLGLTPQL